MSQKKKKALQCLKLTKNCKEFINEYFDKINWGNLIFSGKWEQDYLNSAKTFHRFFSDFSVLLANCTSLNEQIQIYKKNSAALRIFSVILRLDVFKIYLLGFFNVIDTHLSYRKVMASRRMFFNAMVSSFLKRKISSSFFYSILFTGKYNCSVAPTSELSQERYYDIKKYINRSNVFYVNEDILNFSQHAKIRFDFVSLSNITDYLDRNSYADFMQKLKVSLKKNAKVVLRQLFPMPASLNTKGYTLSTLDSHAKTIDDDTTPFYKTDLYIYNTK